MSGTQGVIKVRAINHAAPLFNTTALFFTTVLMCEQPYASKVVCGCHSPCPFFQRPWRERESGKRERDFYIFFSSLLLSKPLVPFPEPNLLHVQTNDVRAGGLLCRSPSLPREHCPLFSKSFCSVFFFPFSFNRAQQQLVQSKLAPQVNDRQDQPNLQSSMSGETFQLLLSLTRKETRLHGR